MKKIIKKAINLGLIIFTTISIMFIVYYPIFLKNLPFAWVSIAWVLIAIPMIFIIGKYILFSKRHMSILSLPLLIVFLVAPILPFHFPLFPWVVIALLSALIPMMIMIGKYILSSNRHMLIFLIPFLIIFLATPALPFYFNFPWAVVAWLSIIASITISIVIGKYILSSNRPKLIFLIPLLTVFLTVIFIIPLSLMFDEPHQWGSFFWILFISPALAIINGVVSLIFSIIFYKK